MDPLLLSCPQCGKQLKLPDRRWLGRRGKCKRCGHRFILQEPDEIELEPVDEPGPSGPAIAPGPPNRPDEATDEFPSFDVGPAADHPGLRKLRERKRRQARRTLLLAALILAGLLLPLGAFVIWQTLSTPRTAADPPAESRSAGRPASRDDPPAQPATLADWPEDPTQGDPVPLRFLPMGANIIIHLRPAELWREQAPYSDVRAGLGPLAEWAESRLQALCLDPPQKIERAVIGLYLGIPGEPPEIAAAVRLTEEVRRSELILEFKGERVDEYAHPVYLADGRAWMIHDLRTIAVAPEERAAEMVRARKRPHPPAVALEQLLPHTDRKRHLTVLFPPQDVRRFREELFPEPLRPLMNRGMGWFGENVEAVAWSLHLDDRLYSEWLLRNRHGLRSGKLQRKLREKLDRLPRKILETVRRMSPDTAGTRRLVGRFPAMTKVLSLATEFDRTPHLVRAAAVLPDRAAPNLAVAARLTWEEYRRTDFTAPKPDRSSEPDLPDKVVDRLAKKIEIEFRRTPLHEALAYIGESTHVSIEIDGQALKLAGYTQNMPQTMDLGTVPATRALHEILKQYEEMVLVVDEGNDRATVTTRAAAEENDQSPLQLAP